MWALPIIVDMTDVALCAEKDPQNFSSNVCANTALLQNLLANQDNSWLIQHCYNYSRPGGVGGQGGNGGFSPAEQCQYSNWTKTLPNVTLLTLCWEHDQTRFVSLVCPTAATRFRLSQDLASVWVSSMCSSFTNFTDANGNGNTSCVVQSLARQLNWSCSAELASACQQGADPGAALQAMAHCWVEGLGSRVEDLLAPPAAAVLEQAVSSALVILLALEEVRNISMHVTQNIRGKVLGTITDFLKNEDGFARKRVLLQCFGVGGPSTIMASRECRLTCVCVCVCAHLQRVLTNLMKTTRETTSEQSFIIKVIQINYLVLMLPIMFFVRAILKS